MDNSTGDYVYDHKNYYGYFDKQMYWTKPTKADGEELRDEDFKHMKPSTDPYAKKVDIDKYILQNEDYEKSEDFNYPTEMIIEPDWKERYERFLNFKAWDLEDKGDFHDDHYD